MFNKGVLKLAGVVVGTAIGVTVITAGAVVATAAVLTCRLISQKGKEFTGCPIGEEYANCKLAESACPLKEACEAYESKCEADEARCEMEERVEEVTEEVATEEEAVSEV